MADLIAARRMHGTARFEAIVGGGASVVFGLLALAWPDVTVFVIAVVFGARTFMAGVRQIVGFANEDEDLDWDQIIWPVHEEHVRRLRRRIVKATQGHTA